MVLKTQHSRLGIASVLLGLAIWAYFGLVILILFRTDALSKFIGFWEKPKHGQITGTGFEGVLEMILLFIFLFVVVPAFGHITGLVLAMAGCIQQKRKRLFAIIGFPINALYFILVAMIFLGAGLRQG